MHHPHRLPSRAPEIKRAPETKATTAPEAPSRRYDERRPIHANPIVEHMFRRFEAGIPLIQIGHEITGIAYRPPEKRTAQESHCEAWAFMTTLVMATIAPGTEYVDDTRRPLPADLAERQDEARL